MCALTRSHARACIICFSSQFLAAAQDLESDDAQQPPCLHANLLYAGEFGDIVIEVQLHLFSIIEIKKESHKLYEVVRAATMEALRN